MLNPEIILSTNHEIGFTKIECNKTTIEVTEAKAANTLICPTLWINDCIIFAPIKYPTKYPENKKPVDDRPKFS